MDRGAQWATVHGVEESWMGLRDSAQHSKALCSKDGLEEMGIPS